MRDLLPARILFEPVEVLALYLLVLPYAGTRSRQSSVVSPDGSRARTMPSVELGQSGPNGGSRPMTRIGTGS